MIGAAANGFQRRKSRPLPVICPNRNHLMATRGRAPKRRVSKMHLARTTLRRGGGNRVLALGIVAAALLTSSPLQAESPKISDRIEAVFELLLQHPADPGEKLKRRALERRATEHAGAAALAYREAEAAPAPFQSGFSGDAISGVFAKQSPAIALARLPRPRPEPPIITGSIAPAEQEPASVRETDFFGRFAGSFAGSGEVKRNARANPNQVKCTLTGRPSADGVTISGQCGASFFSKEVSADIRLDPASGAYTGTYVGAAVGPAKLWGKRRGDQVVLTITWPKPVNGDTKATMTIRNSGDGTLAIVVTDEVHPGGPKAEVTRLALNQL
ncbi:MAG: hypothetical protein ACRED5_11400 [Propylenella sp.]